MYEVKTFTERMGDGKKKFINNEEFKNECYFIFFIEQISENEGKNLKT